MLLILYLCSLETCLLHCAVSYKIYLIFRQSKWGLWLHHKAFCAQNSPVIDKFPKPLLSVYLHVLLLHLCPVCALKAMFPGLHTLVMDGMKCITAPRGALHPYNSPELTSTAALQPCSISHTAAEVWVPNGKQDVWFEGRNGHETHKCCCLFASGALVDVVYCLGYMIT